MSSLVLKTFLNDIKNKLLLLELTDYYDFCLPSIILFMICILFIIIGIIEKKKYINLKLGKIIIKKEYLDTLLILGVINALILLFVSNIICKIGYASISWILVIFGALALILYFFIIHIIKFDVIANLKKMVKKCKVHNTSALLCSGLHKEQPINYQDSDSSSSDNE